MKWSFYEMLWGKQGAYYEFVKAITVGWPTPQFHRLAEEMGYNRLVLDQTIIGGYFVNEDGDCLICIGSGMDPAAIYG